MKAIDDFMQSSIDSATPFCLFACSNEPHSPWNKGDASRYPPDEVELPPYIVDTPEMRDDFSHYLAEITYYDDQVGQILALIDEKDVRDNTLVMVVSEQGNSFPFAKWTCYGSGLQSAMIVRWPGKVSEGAKTDAMVEYTDVAPTFVEAAGGTPDSGLDGRSFLKVLTGEVDRHKDYTYGEMTTRGIINGSDLFGIRSVRDVRYRLIWNLNHEIKFTNACTSAGYFQSMVAKAESGDAIARELVNKYHHRPEFELYDCQADPLEMSNLAGAPELAKVQSRLKGKLDEWMASQGDLGKETEQRALLRQKKYKDMTLRQADVAWKTKGNRNQTDKKKKKKK